MKDSHNRACLFLSFLCLVGCGKRNNTLVFVTSPDYPPFEFYQKGKLSGFDIEIASLLAQQMGRKAIFYSTSFPLLFPTVALGSADIAISTLTYTPERAQHFDFSHPYYVERMAVVFLKTNETILKSWQKGCTMGCQVGTVMELWLKQHMPLVSRMLFDHTTHAIEALKSRHVEAVLMDEIQAATFCRSHPVLAYSSLKVQGEGYAMALSKGSPLVIQVNNALLSLKKKGLLEKLKRKWNTLCNPS